MYVFGQLSMILWFLIDNPWKIIIEVDSYRFTVVRDRRGNVLTHHFVHVQHVQINPEQRILSFKKVFFSKDSLSQKILFLKRVFFTKYSLLKRFFYSEQNFSLKILFLKSFLFSKDSFSQSLPLQKILYLKRVFFSKTFFLKRFFFSITASASTYLIPTY